MMLNQLVRYEPVLRLVREAGGETVLEVGAGPEGLLRLLGGERHVTAVDVASFEGADEEGRVVADARVLPFPDESFDVVRVVPNENLRAHELLMRGEMTRRTRPLVDLVERALEPVLHGHGRAWRSPLLALVRGLDRGAVYRTIVVADRP